MDEPNSQPLDDVSVPQLRDPFAKPGQLRRAMRFVSVAWLFGAVWGTATGGAPLALFAKGLGASRFEFGVLAAIPSVATLLGPIGTLLTEMLRRRKIIFLVGLYSQRLLWFILAPLVLWVMHITPHANRRPALLLFLVLMFLQNVGSCIGGVPWTSWMSDIVPQRVQGRYFNRRRQIGILSAIPTACLVGWWLDHRVEPTTGAMLTTCALIFSMSAIFGMVDIASFQFVPEPLLPPRRGEPPFASLKAPLKDRQFLLAVGFTATMTFALGFMGQFVTLYLIERVHATNFQTQVMLLILPMIAQLLVLPVWGITSDRMGKKPLLILSGLGMVLPGLGWSFLTGHDIWFGYLVAGLGAGLYAGIETANQNLVIEMSGGAGSSYVAANSIITSIATCIGGITAGIMATLIGNWQWHPSGRLAFLDFKTFDYFDVLFAFSAVFRLMAVVIFLPRLQEPTARPAAEALRFMTANIYSNLAGVVTAPFRLGGRRED